MKLSKTEIKIAHYRMGIELKLLRSLIQKLRVDPEYQEMFNKKDLAPLASIENKIDKMRSDLENKMFNRGYEWADIGVYYGNDYDSLYPIIDQVREDAAKIAITKSKENIP